MIMKKKIIFVKVFFIVFLLSISLFNIEVYGENIKVGNKESNIGVEFKGTETSGTEKKIPKDNIYKPIEPDSVRNLLPNTGETILTFLFILFGFSIVLFVAGVIMIQRTMKIRTYSS